MNIRKEQDRVRRLAAKRAFDVVELARRLDVFAEVAEEIYDRAGGKLSQALALAKKEGIASASTSRPPLSAAGRPVRDDPKDG